MRLISVSTLLLLLSGSGREFFFLLFFLFFLTPANFASEGCHVDLDKDVFLQLAVVLLSALLSSAFAVSLFNQLRNLTFAFAALFDQQNINSFAYSV